MAKIRLTKEFGFEMSHSLWQYDGLCKNIHGHSYKLFVTVLGEPIQDDNNPKNGMVMDFGDLKKIVMEEIVDPLDHSIVFYEKAPVHDLFQVPEMFERRHLTSYQPTCENMIVEFAQKIKARLPERIQLHSLKLHETANSYAEWFAADNE